MVEDVFSPNVGAVVAYDPAVQKIGPKRIPTDSIVVFGDVHPNKTNDKFIEVNDVDEIFAPKNLGPISLTFQFPDIRKLLHGDDAPLLTAKREIKSVRAFSLMNTLTETERPGAEGLDRVPLLATFARLYAMKDFTSRLEIPAFRDMLAQQNDEYLTQLDNVAQSVKALGTGTPAPTAPTNLVQTHMGELNVSVQNRAIGLNAPKSMLTGDAADDAIFATSCPVRVGDEPFPVPQSDFLLDRIETEKQLVATHAANVDVAKKVDAIAQLATQSVEKVFTTQAPYQGHFYSLQQAFRPGPNGKVGTPFRLMNRSLSSLKDKDGAGFKKLLQDLPGRRATDFSKSVDTILMLDEVMSEDDVKHVGRFAEEIRAVAVFPIHKTRPSAKAVPIHKNQFPTLYGIRKAEDSYKRYVYPIAGSYMADTDNPWCPSVPISYAAIAAGTMIENADKIALAPAGDRMPIETRGEVRTGCPLEVLVNAPDPSEMPGVNRVSRRTEGFFVLNGAATPSNEATFQLAPVTRAYNDLVKHISDLMLTRLMTQDTDAARKELRADIDKLIMSKSGPDDIKSLNGGKVTSIENAKNPDGTPRPGVLVITMRVDFKYILFGVELRIVPEELSLTVTKPGN